MENNFKCFFLVYCYSNILMCVVCSQYQYTFLIFHILTFSCCFFFIFYFLEKKIQIKEEKRND